MSIIEPIIEQVVTRSYIDILWMAITQKNQHPIEENIRTVYNALCKSKQEEKTYSQMRTKLSNQLKEYYQIKMNLSNEAKELNKTESIDSKDLKHIIRNIALSKLKETRVSSQINSIDDTLALHYKTEERLQGILLDLHFQLMVQRDHDSKLDVSGISIKDIQMKTSKLMLEARNQDKQLERLQSVLNNALEPIREDAREFMAPLEEQICKELGLS